DGAGRVEENVGPVKPGGPGAEQSHVGLERHPGQGVPVAGVERREGPTQRAPPEAAENVRVLGYVLLVVKGAAQVMTKGGAERETGEDGQTKANGEVGTKIRHGGHR